MRKRSLSPEERDTLRRLHAEGASQRRMAQNLDIHTSVVRRELLEMGLKLRRATQKISAERKKHAEMVTPAVKSTQVAWQKRWGETSLGPCHTLPMHPDA